MYNEALKLFNVEIRKSGRGHIVVVIDDIGNPIRYPIRLSNFKEGPKFYLSESQKISIEKNENEYQLDTIPKFDEFQMAQLARDLNRLVERSREPDSKLKQRVQRKEKE